MEDRKHYRTVIISDVHIGSAHSKVKEAADFLGSVNPTSVAPAIARRLCYYQTEWLRKLKERLTPKVVTCGNDLYDILKTIGFSDALLQRIGIAKS